MKLYLGIDIGKSSFTAALCTENLERQIIHPEVMNQADGWQTLKEWVLKQSQEMQATQIQLGVESTGGYEKPMVEWFRSDTNFTITILNPVRVKRFAQSELSRTKNDLNDARLIARYLAIRKPNPTPVTAPEIEELKIMVRHLEHLTRKQADEKTYLETVVEVNIRQQTQQIFQFYQEQIEKVLNQIRKHIDSYPNLQHQSDLLQSIPGIGKITSAILLTECIPSLTPKQQVSHAGLAPRQNQSGKINGKTQLCKTGNKRLRTALYLPTLCAIRHNPIIHEFYQRLIGRGKPKMVAVGACMRKFVHIIVGVLKNQQYFNPFYAKNLS